MNLYCNRCTAVVRHILSFRWLSLHHVKKLSTDSFKRRQHASHWKLFTGILPKRTLVMFLLNVFRVSKTHIVWESEPIWMYMQSEMFQRSFCHVSSSQYAPIFCHFQMALAGSCNNLLKNSSEGEDYRFAFFRLCCGARGRVQNEMCLCLGVDPSIMMWVIRLVSPYPNLTT